MEHSSKDEQIMILLTRIDERTLNLVEAQKGINVRLGSHDDSIGKLKDFASEYKGTARATGWIAGISSSVVLSLILYSLGLKK